MNYDLASLISKYDSLHVSDIHSRELYGQLIKQQQLSDIRKSELEHKIAQGVNIDVAATGEITASKNIKNEVEKELKRISSTIKLEQNDSIGHMVWQAIFCQECEVSEYAEEIVQHKRYKSEQNKLKKYLDTFFNKSYKENAYKYRVAFRNNVSKISRFRDCKDYIGLTYILPNIESWVSLTSEQQQQLIDASNGDIFTLIETA